MFFLLKDWKEYREYFFFFIVRRSFSLSCGESFLGGDGMIILLGLSLMVLEVVR